jgi:hypothetical protein
MNQSTMRSFNPCFLEAPKIAPASGHVNRPVLQEANSEERGWLKGHRVQASAEISGAGRAPRRSGSPVVGGGSRETGGPRDSSGAPVVSFVASADGVTVANPVLFPCALCRQARLDPVGLSGVHRCHLEVGLGRCSGAPCERRFSDRAQRPTTDLCDVGLRSLKSLDKIPFSSWHVACVLDGVSQPLMKQGAQP